MKNGTKIIEARPRELVDVLRRARVEGRALALRGPSSAPSPPGAALLRLVAGKDAHVTLDGHNSVAEIDGALPLVVAARRLERLGAVLPLARPLPALSVAAACAAMPFFVDACVQQASGLTFDGDEWESPRAPRAAAGPSLLGALCSRPPLAVAVRVRVRVLIATHAVVVREEHADANAAARRVRELLEEGRAFAVDACGTSVLVLAGSQLPLASSPGSSLGPSAGPGRALASPFAHAGLGRRAAFARSESLPAGDAAGMADALSRGARVVAAPLMGRAASLWRGFEPIRVLETRRGVHALAEALAAAAATAPRTSTTPPGGGAP